MEYAIATFTACGKKIVGPPILPLYIHWNVNPRKFDALAAINYYLTVLDADGKIADIRKTWLSPSVQGKSCQGTSVHRRAGSTKKVGGAGDDKAGEPNVALDLKVPFAMTI